MRFFRCPWSGSHCRAKCSSSADSAMLARSGESIPPYEQCRVMRSAGLPALVTAMLGVKHCALCAEDPIRRSGMVPGQHDRRSAVMATLSALVSGLEAELRRLGYKDSTLVWYRGCWRRMHKRFAARGIEEFSLDAAMAWVDDACGFFSKEQAGTLKRTDVYLFRVAQMLGEYETHGAVLRRYNRSVKKLDGPGADAAARFQAWLRAADRSVSTVRTYGTIAGEFIAFTGTRGGLIACDA